MRPPERQGKDIRGHSPSQVPTAMLNRLEGLVGLKLIDNVHVNFSERGALVLPRHDSGFFLVGIRPDASDLTNINLSTALPERHLTYSLRLVAFSHYNTK